MEIEAISKKSVKPLAPSKRRENTNFSKDHWLCDVCLGSENIEVNPLLECQNCRICAHTGCLLIFSKQEVDFLDSNLWTCQKCAALQASPCSKIQCSLCPDQSGVVTLITREKVWVHFYCINWSNSHSFDETADKLNQSLKKTQSVCGICSLKGMTIICDSKNCKAKFHPRCARSVGIIRKQEFMDQVKGNVFCLKHLQEGYPDQFKLIDSSKSKLGFPTLKIEGFQMPTDSPNDTESNQSLVAPDQCLAGSDNDEELKPRKRKKTMEEKSQEVINPEVLEQIEREMMVFLGNLKEQIFVSDCKGNSKKKKAEGNLKELMRMIGCSRPGPLFVSFSVKPFDKEEKTRVQEAKRKSKREEEKKQETELKPFQNEKELDGEKSNRISTKTALLMSPIPKIDDALSMSSSSKENNKESGNTLKERPFLVFDSKNSRLECSEKTQFISSQLVQRNPVEGFEEEEDAPFKGVQIKISGAHIPDWAMKKKGKIPGMSIEKIGGFAVRNEETCRQVEKNSDLEVKKELKKNLFLSLAYQRVQKLRNEESHSKMQRVYSGAEIFSVFNRLQSYQLIPNK